MKFNQLGVLIPAAGKGSRSKLDYPKTLFKVSKKTILSRILNKIYKYSDKISIVINIKYKGLVLNELKQHQISKIEFLYQNKALGMGDAILKTRKSKYFNDISDILLIWGDLPFITRTSLDKLIYNHFKHSNFMTILSYKTKNPYTLIVKDKNDYVCDLIETKLTNKKFNYGERDLGVFLFKKDLLNYLYKNKKIQNSEHNFLYIIKILYKLGFKIKSLPIAKHKETISLNYISDLNK